MAKKTAARDPMTQVLSTFRKREAMSFDDAWVGIEPTFQSRQSVEKWRKLAGDGKEDAYFEDRYMLSKQKAIAERIVKTYRKARKKKDERCMFASVERREELDRWGVVRQSLAFRWPADSGNKLEPFEVNFGLDPETFEYSIKPVPAAWFYEPRFVGFVDHFLFDIPMKMGLSPSIAHGGAQFSVSAKTFMGGSLLADDIATKLNHPELSLWTMDWPNPDDRAFRATRPRFAACRAVLDAYWKGGFHPRALGTLTVEDVYHDRGFGPAASPRRGLMDPRRGPKGSAVEVFRTNFAFGRAFRLLAQAVRPGYWQESEPKEEGYLAAQIMRYSEGNLNRLQLAGEFHVKSGKPLDEEDVPELSAPIDISMLYMEASWENRAQMGRTSARDFVEALLLDLHHARWLTLHPHVKVIDSLLQDQLLGDGEATLSKHGGAAALAALRKEARERNFEVSKGRIRSDAIEPETLLWAVWNVLPRREAAKIADEIVRGFVARVMQASECDPRPPATRDDPMEWHRHRIHPALWRALDGARTPISAVARAELKAWQAKEKQYRKRRPVFSQSRKNRPPWKR